MSYLNKVSNTSESTRGTTRSLVAYTMPFYMHTLPERVSGTGEPTWDELSPEQKQLHTSIHPTVANAAYKAHAETAQAIRMDSIIALARVLDDANLEIALTALNITPEHLLLKLPK